MKWSLISSVNNDEVLKTCLLNSSEAQSASEIFLQRGFADAAAAYNDAIDKATTDVLVFAHQDVYLPEGWADSLREVLETLAREDPQWGVLGVWGTDAAGRGTGDLYCTYAMRRIGGAFVGAKEVRCLDEVMLIVRKSSGLRFDEQMKGFHMYGSDICLSARKMGLKSYVVPVFCVHNTNGFYLLPREFWKCYFYMRRKWRAELPIITPCAKITTWCWPVIKDNALRLRNVIFKRCKALRRVPDPGQLYREQFSQGRPSATPVAAKH
ncbi:MAG TPA: glycosyltransferase [Verrucomicrobiae bacterium]|jgi:hypothetical protein|nr:glycosyltransferase [Verrucomicrobiae bacterium]